MFAYHLTFDEKEALLRLVGHLATADREVSPQERKFVSNLAHDLNVSAQGVFEGLDETSLEQLCEQFERDSARKLAIVQLVDLGLADNEYFAEEKAGVREVAERMGISEEEVERIERWVSKGRAWQEEGRELLGLESGQKVSL
ncbi:MAG: TerB family tellurite resistance protein [Persicimonas sp.]